MVWSLRTCPLPVFVSKPNNDIFPANTAAVVLQNYCKQTRFSNGLKFLLKEISSNELSVTFAEPKSENRVIKNSDGDTEITCRIWCIPYIHEEHALNDCLLIYLSLNTDINETGFTQVLELNLARDIFWDEYARSYDRILPLVSFYQIALERHTSAIIQANSKNILDLGGGTANVAIPLAQYGCHVTLVDPSSAMLARARKKVINHKLMNHLEIIEQSAEEIHDFPAESFDAINVLLALFCMDDAQAVLKHAVRVLRPGGIMVFTEPTKTFNEDPLIETGEAELRLRSDWKELEFDWQVVASAGHRLGILIRELEDSSPQANQTKHKLRAENLSVELERLGCVVKSEMSSHLGQCRYIVAYKNG